MPSASVGSSRGSHKLFAYTDHVIPFIPPPYCGTNGPDLVHNLYHVTPWLNKVQPVP
jgi:hypothetical protein